MGGYYFNDESFCKDFYCKFGCFNFNVCYCVIDWLIYGFVGNFNVGKSGFYFYWLGLEIVYIGDIFILVICECFCYNFDFIFIYYDKNDNCYCFLGCFYSVDNDNDCN